jgi:hypothetical protein
MIGKRNKNMTFINGKKFLTLAVMNLLLISLLGNTALGAQSQFGSKSLIDVVTSNLRYIESEQIAQTGSIYIKGEWPTHIHSTLVPGLVGVGKLVGHNEEASAFTTGSVVNQLASLYLDHPELQNQPQFEKIPGLIAAAVPTFERYREGDLFNFYPPKMWKGVRVHQPADMQLMKAWKGFTNVPEDADTSSVVYSALLYSAKLENKKFQVPEKVLASMSQFRDEDRKPQFYNKGQNRRNTGAFMTWQVDENDPQLPRFWFAPPEKGVRIPFNKNDVDCVVNLNVLRMLALNKTQNVSGRTQACNMINDMILKNEHAACGIYYPNTFNLAYSIAQAERAGESCVQSDRKKDTVKFILGLQSADGGWDNDKNIWIDRIQSTAFAMTGLLQFADGTDPGVQSSLMYGTAFLLRNIKLSKSGDMHWSGELFFTATAIARGLIAWKSNSYTTATAASVLLKMQKLYPSLRAQDYLDRQR